MCWNSCPSLPGELAVARFQWACPVVLGALVAPPGLANLPQWERALRTLCPGSTVVAGDGALSGDNMFACPYRGNSSAFSLL